MSAAPTLPQELFDYIIDHLFDDVESLRACALVSSNLFSSSRTHIFSHVKVGPVDPEHHIDELREILARSPYLVTYVHSLHLYDYIMRRHSWMEEWPESLAPGVAEFLRTLALKRFAVTIDSGFVHWANVSKALRKAIHHTMSTEKLTCVELTGLYGLPFKLLANCPVLKSVTLKWVTFDERDNLDFGVTLAACEGSPLTLLTHLSLDLDTRVLEHLSRWILLPESPLKITSLKSFTCTLDGRFDYITIQRLLLECASSLEYFRLKNINGTPDFSELVRLRTLCLDTVAPLESRFRSLMNGISLPPQSIGLVINMVSENWSPEVVQLAAVDTALAQLQPIGSVRLVMVPQGSASRERDLVEVSSMFAYRMPLLAGRGTLRVFRSMRYPTAERLNI